jgi:uncharacterized protein (TIGR03435 family)
MSRTITRLPLAVIGVVILLQVATAQKLEFEVASVKPGAPVSQRAGFVMRGAELRASNLLLRFIIEQAYDIHPSSHRGVLEGGPAWIDAEGFDIVAKASAPLTGDVARIMLRALLADRFKLRVHTDRREGPVYALVQAKKDGVLGPGLHRSAEDCGDFSNALVHGEQGRAAALRVTGCETTRPNAGPRGQTIRGSITMAALAVLLSQSRDIDRPVVDRTGLDGTFDVNLQWTPAPTGPTADNAIFGSIFTAVQEQLGLKLESQRALIEVTVIDSVELPIPN